MKCSEWLRGDYTRGSQPKVPWFDSWRSSAPQWKVAAVPGDGDWGFVRAAFAVSRLTECSDVIHALCEWLHQN